ncbi:ribosome biogenesis GTPase [Tamaricihabitans halophyticus]|uniref:Small ribosomal subunit biogenesis GTPase RsgA n=1 Tax=Tamaricihabitans halophyticus TaxID=1262583 RepID=A0A4R2QH53_9PSEU|nr:ribosome small subunit-dependent GTPase A [Tamaricihabitans halophyticus]TCP48467.1 ribosome biogenesis GTPase [Tamaricihabitans halophyticus]
MPSGVPDNTCYLDQFGWNDAVARSFAEYRAEGLRPARVARTERGQCMLVTTDGARSAELAEALRGADPMSAPCTGDWVAWQPGDPDTVRAVLPRQTTLARSSASGRSEGQVLATNVDIVVIVASLTATIVLSRIERFLALAWESGAQPVVALTKADEAEDPDGALAEVSSAAAGAEVFAISAVTGSGMAELTAALTGTIVLIGPSGTGKSTLGNALLAEDRLAVGRVRGQDGKGRHTTTSRELVALPSGGVLIDTPGLRGVGLWAAEDATGNGVQQAFPEIEELAEQCRFRDCGHDAEPGCAVLAALDAGELPMRRLASYRKLLRENEWIASRSDARKRAERTRQTKVITKSLRQTYKFRNR